MAATGPRADSPLFDSKSAFQSHCLDNLEAVSANIAVVRGARDNLKSCHRFTLGATLQSLLCGQAAYASMFVLGRTDSRQQGHVTNLRIGAPAEFDHAGACRLLHQLCLN